MAIDKNKTKDLLIEIDSLFEEVMGKFGTNVKEFIKSKVMGPALEEIIKIIEESRAPVFYLIGRSGHGKSSLINALAGKEVAEVGPIKPTTRISIPYLITFENEFACWQVVDSRGLFESTPPNGAANEFTVRDVRNDVLKYKPDVLMHVISAPESRNLSNDLKVFSEILDNIRSEIGATPPTIIVMTKVDTLGNPRDWPPEANAKKAALIKDVIDYMVKDVLKVGYKQIDLNTPLKGYLINNSHYVCIIPVSALYEDKWNIETLSDIIGRHLPENAILDFVQAQKRKKLLRDISSSLCKRFGVIASAIGTAPVPISDIIILSPLQMLLIILTGGLSCKPFSKDTGLEFLGAMGITFGVGVAFRYAAQELVKVIPFLGPVISGSIAGVTTYAIGKSAEAYFFAGEIRKPKDFEDEGEKIIKS